MGFSRAFMHSQTRESRGFTLIELLVVIAIIGILSSVVLASLGTARVKARDARRLSDMKQMQLALELWNDANSGEYPDTLTPLTTPTEFLPSVPLEPDGDAYIYQNFTSSYSACAVATGACTSYVLSAIMEGPVPAGGLTGTFGSGGDSVNCSVAGRYCVRP